MPTFFYGHTGNKPETWKPLSEDEQKKVRYHLYPGSDYVTKPTHGQDGYHHQEHYIYFGHPIDIDVREVVDVPVGWYPLRTYQAIKKGLKKVPRLRHINDRLEHFDDFYGETKPLPHRKPIEHPSSGQLFSR